MQQEETSIFVRNLDEKVTEELLYELFLQAGPLEDVRIPSTNGISRNYGFVVYTHEESVPYAINLLDGTTLFGRSILLKDARRQQNYPPRGPPQRSLIKDRLGPRPVEDSSCLRTAPGFAGRRYNDLSMQPTRSSKNKERNEEDPRHRNAWTQPGSLNLYPSQKGDAMRGHNSNHSLNVHLKHKGRNDIGSFSQSRKPYEKPFHQRDHNRYDRHFRRSN